MNFHWLNPVVYLFYKYHQTWLLYYCLQTYTELLIRTILQIQCQGTFTKNILVWTSFVCINPFILTRNNFREGAITVSWDHRNHEWIFCLVQTQHGVMYWDYWRKWSKNISLKHISHIIMRSWFKSYLFGKNQSECLNCGIVMAMTYLKMIF